MDLFFLLFLSCVSILFGIILTLVLQYYVLIIYFKKGPVTDIPKKCKTEAYSLPEALRKELESKGYCDKKSNSSSLSISLMLQFLFHELRHSDAVKRWLYKKLSMEFDELLTKTTIGKFFEAVTIRDMNLGSQFPDIKNITTENVKLDKDDGHIETLNICADIEYSGNFSLSVDAKMKFGKTAYLSIKVKRISGLARLQFTRYPYTHWSFSFYEDPILELAVESHFQGRQLQSNVTNLILNQIKKAFKRKHTLPNYQIRYKPFFVKTDPGQLDLDDSEIVAQGQLSVTCIEITRIAASSELTNMYYTIAIDSIPWITLYQKENDMCMVLELTMTKLRQTQSGLIFKQDQGAVIVDSVTPNSPAWCAGFKPCDVLLAVESKNVASIQQVSKLMKSVNTSNLSFRIERVVENYIMKYESVDKTDTSKNICLIESEIIEDPEITQVEQDSFVIVEKMKSGGGDNIEGSGKKSKSNFRAPLISSGEKIAQTLGGFALRKRKGSSDSNIKGSTPVSSNPGTPQHSITKQHTPVEGKAMPEIVRTDSESLDSEVLSSTVEVYKGKEVAVGSVVSFNKEYTFNLKENNKYLNINIWGVNTNERDVLLGYANVPLAQVLYECCSSVLGHYIKCYSFLPPNNLPPSSHPLITHSGFEHVFCYGDILLSFVWTHDGSVEIQQKTPVSTISNQTSKTESSFNKHNFVRKQFHGTTHCDFCTKKIWLKDAVQCKECRLCCHKKCVSKCQMSTECVPTEKTNGTEREANIIDEQSDMALKDSWTDVSDEQVPMNLKRVNSANSLTVPGSSGASNQSMSLPPSPQRTPSRKQSLVAINPFLLCPEVLDDIYKQPLEAPEHISKLLQQMIVYPADDSLMTVAKETGIQLYANLPQEEKVEKINFMVTELKKALDAVSTEHADLSKKLAQEESEVEKTKIVFLIGQTDAKVNALSVLMLHYCSGMQQSQEKII